MVAQDICFSIDAVLQPKNDIPWAAPYREHISGCEVVDRGEGGAVVVSFAQLEPRPRDWLNLPVLPAHAFRSTVIAADHPFRDHAFGSLGMVADRSSRGVSYRAVDRDAERPTIRRFEQLAIPEDEIDMVRELLDGRVHGIVSVPYDLVPALAARDDIYVKAYDTHTLWYVDLDLSHPWLADPRTRRALDRLIDREALSKRIYDNPQEVSPPFERITGPFVQSSPAYNRAVPAPPPDPVEALWLLAEVGQERPGERLALTVGAAPGDAVSAILLEGLVEQLRDAGIAASRIAGDRADLVLRTFSPDPLGEPRALIERVSEDAPPGLSALVEASQKARTDTALDEAGRALHAWMAEERPVLFLWRSGTKSAWRTEVRSNTIGPVTYWGEFGFWSL